MGAPWHSPPSWCKERKRIRDNEIRKDNSWKLGGPSAGIFWSQEGLRSAWESSLFYCRLLVCYWHKIVPVTLIIRGQLRIGEKGNTRNQVNIKVLSKDSTFCPYIQRMYVTTLRSDRWHAKSATVLFKFEQSYHKMRGCFKHLSITINHYLITFKSYLKLFEHKKCLNNHCGPGAARFSSS